MSSHQRIGYARVSTSKQSLERQEAELEGAGCARIFSDKITGAARSGDRPGFVEALGYLRNGDELAVSSLDRLARSLHELLAIVGDLRARGVALYVVDRKWRVGGGDPTGDLLLAVFGAIAEFELELIRERSRSAREAAIANGKRIGRAPALTEIEQRGALAMLQEGGTVREVARAYNSSKSTIARLRRRELAG
jgi:DNA invertase Pin-like site-specific DNA recombinase